MSWWTLAAIKQEQVSATSKLIYLIGYSGEDCPRSVIPSYVGLCDGAASEDVDMEQVIASGASKRRIITGSAELNFKRDRMEIQPLITADGIRKYIY